jgi:hypothetical protein
LEAIAIYEENSTYVYGKKVILIHDDEGSKEKGGKTPSNANKLGEKEGQYCKKSNHQKKKCFWNLDNPKNKLKEK